MLVIVEDTVEGIEADTVEEAKAEVNLILTSVPSVVSMDTGPATVRNGQSKKRKKKFRSRQ